MKEFFLFVRASIGLCHFLVDGALRALIFDTDRRDVAALGSGGQANFDFVIAFSRTRVQPTASGFVASEDQREPSLLLRMRG